MSNEDSVKLNRINLLIGRRGSGKTNAVLREVIKLKPTHLIYVNDNSFDDTYMKQHIPIQMTTIKYNEAEEFLTKQHEDIESDHTIIFFDDAECVFEKKDNHLLDLLFQKRQPTITYFMCIQNPVSIDLCDKSNFDSIIIM